MIRPLHSISVRLGSGVSWPEMGNLENAAPDFLSNQVLISVEGCMLAFAEVLPLKGVLAAFFKQSVTIFQMLLAFFSLSV